MSDDLKPVRCGCGGEANIHKADSTFGQMPIYTVSCNTCGMRSGRRSTEVQAVTAWNKAMETDAREIAEVMAHDIVVTEQLTNKVNMSPIHIDGSIYECPNCRTKVGYVEYTGYPSTTPDTYYDWRVVKHKFCPECGIKLEWE